MSEPNAVPFQVIIGALLDAETPLNPRYLYNLSELNAGEDAALKSAWPRIPLWRRQALIADLEKMGAADLLLTFEEVGKIGLNDRDPLVRLHAVRLLEDYESPDLIAQFERLLEKDGDAEVREAAADALGHFIFEGELEELPESVLHAIEDRLLQALKADPSPKVRRSALSALGYSSREDVPALIDAAFASGDREWVVSALRAMGHSADERWQGVALEMLDHKSASVRTAAARAAGELEISAATPRLTELAEDGETEVRQAAIWSLSQIGGEGVRATLESRLAEAEDDEELELLEDALDNLAFTEGIQPFSLSEIPDRYKEQSGALADEDFLLYAAEEDLLEADLEDDESDEEIDIEAEVLALLDEEDEEDPDGDDDEDI